MQQAETSTVDAQKIADAPKITRLLDISTDDKGMVYVNWPIDKKDICITALCESLKLVASYQKPIVEVPKPRLRDFILGKKNG